MLHVLRASLYQATRIAVLPQRGLSGSNILWVNTMTFVAGKRRKPTLLYVILVVIALSLVYFSVHRGGGGVLPQDPPMHDN
jgi:hypothetical protein